MTPRRFRRLRRVLDRRQPDLTVLMDNVHKPHNFAAVLRTCDAVGVLEAHGVWPEPHLQPHREISAGAGKWVQVRTHPDVEAAAAHLRERGFTLGAAHASQSALDYRAFDYRAPVALLLGAERDGLGERALALADVHLAVPMVGFGRSLNVSVAAAVILFEAQRQRESAGLYARPRLDPERYARTLFEWAYPELARQCRARGCAYPSLGPSGELLEPCARDAPE